MVPLYLPKFKINSFGIIGSLLAFNIIAFWGVATCDLVDLMSVVVEYVTWVLGNFEMCFDLCASPLWLKWAVVIHQKLLKIRQLLKKYKHGS